MLKNTEKAGAYEGETQTKTSISWEIMRLARIKIKKKSVQSIILNFKTYGNLMSWKCTE